MKEAITILRIAPGKAPKVETIPCDYREMQKVVGGTVQAIYPWEDKAIAMCCNDDGKILHLIPNRAIFMREENVTGLLNEPLPGYLYAYNADDESSPGEVADIIVGDFFLCGVGKEDFRSLTEEEITFGMKRFRYPERFYAINGIDSIIRCDYEFQVVAI